MTLPRRALPLLLLATPALAQTEAARRALAPAGVLRVGIGVGAAASAFWAVPGPDGAPRGVTLDLGADLARQLGVAPRFIAYRSSGEVTEAGPRGEWDVAFMPVDDARRQVVDFAPDYVRITSTYMVPAGSSLRSLADVDRPGVRVVGVANTTTLRAAQRSLSQAQAIGVPGTAELLAMLRDGRADAVALGRESLDSLQPQFPGSRILPGHFHATGTAPAVPKGHAEALAYVAQWVAAAKADGTVARALAANNVRAEIAP